MSTDLVDLVRLGERLAKLRRTYGESIDLPNLQRDGFASLLGISGTAYASYECGECEPTTDFLVALRNTTLIGEDWLLDSNEPVSNQPIQ